MEKKFKEWKEIRTGGQIPRTDVNDQQPFRVGEVKILDEPDS